MPVVDAFKYLTQVFNMNHFPFLITYYIQFNNYCTLEVNLVFDLTLKGCVNLCCSPTNMVFWY